MMGVRPAGFRLAALALATLLAAAASAAEYGHATGSEDVVARLTIRSGERTGVRSVTVYGSGRVHAHYPSYLKNAGDREVQLAPGELQALVRRLAESGLPEFDAAAVQAERATLRARRREVHAVLGADVVEIELNLDGYRRRAGDPAHDVRQRVIWRGLPQDARRFPELKALADLAESTALLEALLGRSDLAGSR